MRLHYLQHVPFEGPANIEPWAKSLGFTVAGTRLYEDENLPELNQFDWLVIMGGPMNIYEEDKYPWLGREKRFIAEAIENDKIVLGICLGAQLIADVTGGKVYRNSYKEIGWFPVSLTSEARDSNVFSALPESFIAFHWHGDTFHLPPGAARIAESEACHIQAFEHKNGRVIGLQFHLESSPESIQLLIDNCGDELVEGRYIQKAHEILPRENHQSEIHGLMCSILERLKDSSS
jgi:GMP synthase (glutamine-hydrolysing)